ncbi:hypothetical protein C1Y18_25815 [Pseudomonas sp. MPR-R5A]|nr:hypothetical protein C1Y25_07145 [Pseudomonas sp. MPBC4-3]PMX44434.1 hypothetical protein C1Y20_25550 [Pseudomonas sp. FW301-21B01]PMY03570.1 hypothetical protein C1Y18_25815 [Pseudomonas sp. MPR-R5A]PMY06820.1 hypothetical protein C1Y22_28735 [Pseudomonas sp. MPR-R2A5]PNA56692.1 hypothetical protein C1Y14_33345 [Pseudomonas sp. MPR-R5B]
MQMLLIRSLLLISQWPLPRDLLPIQANVRSSAWTARMSSKRPDGWQCLIAAVRAVLTARSWQTGVRYGHD